MATATLFNGHQCIIHIHRPPPLRCIKAARGRKDLVVGSSNLEGEVLALQLPLGANIALFLIAAYAVWIAGTQLAVAAEEISDRHKLGKDIMGLVFLATATELPEIVTTMFAAVEGQAKLLLNNMFGGIALQTAMLAIADLVALNVAITRFPAKPTPILEGVLLMLTLAVLQGVILLGDVAPIGHVGLGTIFLAGLYVWIIQLLRDQDRNAVWVPVEIPDVAPGDRSKGLLARVAAETGRRLHSRFLLAAATILVFGIVLVVAAEALAVQTGLGASFIGATLLAGSTSLPELSTTVMAVRLHSYTMAISNIFGSNLIMIVLLLPADMIYTRGPLLLEADPSASLALICGVVVTAVYVIGLIVRGSRRVVGMGYDSAAVLTIYAGFLVLLYALRN
ncbi:MAG: sodium:calcium antiporter [Hyphomicrobiaceae bacterium]